MFKALLDKLKPKPKLTEDEITIAKDKAKEEAFKKVARFKRLIKNEQSGWTQFVETLQDYIDKCYIRKLKTRLDIADDKTIEQLKLLDHEIFTLLWVMEMPGQYIKNIEKKDE